MLVTAFLVTSFNVYFYVTSVATGLVFGRISLSQVLIWKEKKNLLYIYDSLGRSSPDNAENSISMANSVADNNRVSTIGLSSRITSGKQEVYLRTFFKNKVTGQEIDEYVAIWLYWHVTVVVMSIALKQL